MVQVETNIKVKFAGQKYILHVLKLLSLTKPNKVLPVDKELYDIEHKINNCKTEFTDDNDDCSTLALTSNPSSFSSTESAEEYFSNKSTFNPKNFTMISMLGSGTFGKVYLSTYENQFYAIKTLPKNKIDKKEMEQIILEKSLLMQLDSPFILRFYGTSQTNNELYFVTELLEHGDLFHAIYNEHNLTHEACVFYTASIILGIDYIHSKNIVYRDLKPENIMIGSNGYPKIIDFGLGRQLPYTKIENGKMRSYSQCYTLCGTPEYFSPELILENGYDYSVDVWAVGVLLYEMIFQKTPFYPETEDENNLTKLFTNIIICGKNGISISKKLDKKTDGTANARNLISQLLSGDKIKRLGGNKRPSVLLNHPYFLSTNIDEDVLYNQSIQAPIIQPQFIGKDITTEKDVEEYHGDHEIFAGF